MQTLSEIELYGNYFSWLGQEIDRLSSIGKRYCMKELTDDEQNTIYKIFIILNRYNFIEKSSDELLCYGYLVVAAKR